MTVTDPQPPTPARRRTQGLRAAALAALVMLVVQYAFGMWVNLYGHLPAADHGAGLPTGFARAVADGPAGLAVHAVLGVALLATAGSVIVRALLAGRRLAVVIGAVGLCAIAVAALAGARFVGEATNTASFAMAIAGGVAMVCYAVILFTTTSTAIAAAGAPRETRRGAEPPGALARPERSTPTTLPPPLGRDAACAPTGGLPATQGTDRD